METRRFPRGLECSKRIESSHSDFGSIAPSASLLVPHLLQALRTRRTAGFHDSLDCQGPIQPTVLILGFSETPTTDRYRYRYTTKRVSSDISNGGTALSQILPSLDSKLFTLQNESFPASPFSSAFFLPSLTDADDLSFLRPSLKAIPINNFITGAASTFVFSKDSHTQAFRKIEQRMAGRRNAVLNAWMTICLGRRDAVVCKNPMDSILSDLTQTSLAGKDSAPNSSDIPVPVVILDELHKRTGIPLPVFLDRIACIALGLSPSQPSSPTVPIQVTPAVVSRACQLFIKNFQARSDWTKAVMGDEDKEKNESEGNEKTADLTVQKLREANDLNFYEEKLLTCIVDCGKHLVF